MSARATLVVAVTSAVLLVVTLLAGARHDYIDYLLGQGPAFLGHAPEPILSAVNEASRIEALCAQHDRNLLVSQTFAQAATRSSARLVSIGRYALRGVRSAQSLYTLDGL